MNKESFILGMITAFCECVAGGCKRLALSPPLTKEDYNPARSLKPFCSLLSYDETECIHTGFDAYREYFITGKKGLRL